MMTRDDLKEGMIIEERSGEKYKVLTGGEVAWLENTEAFWASVDDYNYNLTDYYDRDGDIVRVYDENMNLLWERDDVNKDEEEFTNERLKLCKDYYETSPIKFMEDYLGIKLTFWQKSVLSKALKDVTNEVKDK